jgi:thiol:disulfide interchange protein DsbD
MKGGLFLFLVCFAIVLFAADRDLPVMLTVGSVSEAQGRAGDSLSVTIPIKVTHGYHVNANPAADSLYIPLEITFADTSFADVGKVTYPKGKKWRLKDSEEDLLVYDGSVAITVPLVIPKGAQAGEYQLRGTLDYQACDNAVCFLPETRALNVKVKVLP